jgi:hypothetical protein
LFTDKTAIGARLSLLPLDRSLHLPEALSIRATDGEHVFVALQVKPQPTEYITLQTFHTSEINYYASMDLRELIWIELYCKFLERCADQMLLSCRDDVNVCIGRAKIHYVANGKHAGRVRHPRVQPVQIGRFRFP